MIKGFFFDLDGTLVNTYRADFQAYRDAILEVSNIIISEEMFSKTHGQDMIVKLRALAPGISGDEVHRIAEAKKKYYQKYVGSTKVNESLVQFIGSFAENTVIVLVTTAKRDNATKVLQEHNLEHYFTYMVFGDDVKNRKPHPEPYLKALELSGLSSHEVIVFEDTQSGIQSAEAAGLAVIHVKEFTA